MVKSSDKKLLICYNDNYYLFTIVRITNDRLYLDSIGLSTVSFDLSTELPVNIKIFIFNDAPVFQPVYPAVEKIKYLFPPTSDENFKKIQYENEGLRFVTYAITAKAITKYVYNKIPSNKKITVVDLTGGLGGDTIEYGLQSPHKGGHSNGGGKKVYSVELNKARFQCLKNNISVYGLDNIITAINTNSVEFLNSIKNSTEYVIFSLDPPWGGDDYWKIPEIRDLFLYDTNGVKVSIYTIIATIISNFAKSKVIIVLKLPNNFIFDSKKINKKFNIENKKFHKNIQTIILTSK